MQVIARVASEADLYPFRTKDKIAAFFEAAPAMFEALEELVDQDNALVTLERVQKIERILAQARGVRTA